MSEERRVRLSTYLVFVNYGEEVEVHHTIRGSRRRIDRRQYADLLEFRAFRMPEARHAEWVDAGILVSPFTDAPAYHGGLRPGTEAALGHDYQAWYWRHEVESEREYQWLGRTVLKMPSDLFFYQEVMAANRTRTVLEIGHGDGGGLWFFGTILSMLGGGQVTGVDWSGATEIPELARLPGVEVSLIHGDAHSESAVQEVRELRPEGFQLVVVDADPTPDGKVALLARWARVVAAGGFIVVEDVHSPACRGPEVRDGIDRFLLEHRDFGVQVDAGRAPLLKGRGAVLERARAG